MSDLTARDIHQLDQAAVEAASDVDALADDPETTLRLADRGPAVYAAQLTADLAATAGHRPMTLAAFAAWQTIRRVQERAEMRAKLDGPCGSCHPCTNWADETWRRAGRTPPTVQRWDEVMAELSEARRDLAANEGSEDARLAIAEQRVRLAQGLAEDWAGSKDVVLASAGYALLNVTGGAR